MDSEQERKIKAKQLRDISSTAYHYRRSSASPRSVEASGAAMWAFGGVLAGILLVSSLGHPWQLLNGVLGWFLLPAPIYAWFYQYKRSVRATTGDDEINRLFALYTPADPAAMRRLQEMTRDPYHFVKAVEAWVDAERAAFGLK